MVRLIVLLGNKGTAYTKTRHNAGWLFGDYVIARCNSVGPWQSKFNGEWTTARWNNYVLTILKPMTYMNLSGQSAWKAASYFKITPQEILVVHDDVELEFGTVRIQKGGGLAGHNGLRSMKESLGCDQFMRLRIGIGRPQFQDVASFVLSRFTPEQESVLPLIADLGIDLLTLVLTSESSVLPLPVSRSLP
ncbi:MAG: aminoacyl-tRNA hydrolase [Sphaerochaetaceae bacterium]|jgi:PTH1 family peptidyl-tRNA hydrolase|nr:aminoacyl-tRNA hydrolase [Sphaerochaetaceae bacterium]NLV84676.1 aminoacyl-tRNA hydrolase [Spirochaetales bacterium]